MIYLGGRGRELQKIPQGGGAIWYRYCEITDKYVEFTSHFRSGVPIKVPTSLISKSNGQWIYF